MPPERKTAAAAAAAAASGSRGSHRQKAAAAEPVDAGAVVEPAAAASLRLLTQNVWCHYPMSFVKGCAHAMPGWDCAGRLRRLAAHVAAAGCDVVCVQELFLLRLWPLADNSCNFDLFAGLMAAAGLEHHTDPRGSLRPDRWLGQNSGVAIFSRHPLEACEAVDFEATAEAANTKGFVVADVRVRCRTVRLVSAHCDARDWPAKAAQIAQLALHLASRQAEVPCDAVLVCGDFNVCPQTRDAGGYDDGQQYLHLTAKLGRLDLQDLWAPAESEPTEGRATLDHIFLNAAAWEVGSKRVARVQSEAGLAVSDHHGLEVELRW